jgi:hypothetical protein
MDGEPSLSSTIQLQQPSPRLPEFVHSMVEPGYYNNNILHMKCMVKLVVFSKVPVGTFIDLII